MDQGGGGLSDACEWICWWAPYHLSPRVHQVMRRNAEVVSKLTSFVSALLVDWKTGRLEANMSKRADQARLMLEGLGPAYIKIGQQLSTRVDMVPQVFVEELVRLQDNVKPFSTAEVRPGMQQSGEGWGNMRWPKNTMAMGNGLEESIEVWEPLRGIARRWGSGIREPLEWEPCWGGSTVVGLGLRAWKRGEVHDGKPPLQLVLRQPPTPPWLVLPPRLQGPGLLHAGGACLDAGGKEDVRGT